ncbi:hypothetical protein ACH5AL_12845 [Actinacidiphila glaucinigra]|uniref:hypothetical protein n=1 Tax=Actinacidiphila glaucinigra TaxID=235986 RepID=UPI0037BD6BD9
MAVQLASSPWSVRNNRPTVRARAFLPVHGAPSGPLLGGLPDDGRVSAAIRSGVQQSRTARRSARLTAWSWVAAAAVPGGTAPKASAAAAVTSTAAAARTAARSGRWKYAERGG